MIRYSKLGYVELNVSDLKTSAGFYEDVVGLQPAGVRADGALLFRCDAEPYSIVLNESATPGFKRAGWMLEDDAQVDALADRLKEHNAIFEQLAPAECAMRQFSRAIRVAERHIGATLEFYRPALDATEYAFQPTHTRIQRLGHVVFMSPEKDEAIDFFRKVLNFSTSDNLADFMTFMRPYPNPYHHGIAVLRGPRRVLNHVNFMVTEIDDIGRAFNRLRRRDIPVVFGPGRHVASESVFLYFLEPDGITLEYSFGMEEFDEIDPRKPRVLPPGPESIDSWGAVFDPRFGATGEVEALKIHRSA